MMTRIIGIKKEKVMKNVKQKQEILTLEKLLEICMKEGIPLESEIKVDFKTTTGVGCKNNTIYLKSKNNLTY